MSANYAQERTVVIAGGGLTSLCVLDGILSETGFIGPALRLVWITGGGKPGRGDPYRANNPLAPGETTLNQPAYAMSPFERKPEDYANWLAANTNIENPRHAFTTRRTFGDYCEVAAARLLEEANRRLAFSVDTLHADVTAIRPVAGGRYDVHLGGAGRIQADGVIAATGHTRSTQFDYLNGCNGYIAAPTDRTALRAVASISNSSSRVTFCGGGASMIDGVQLLQGYGYRGRYEVISPDWNFWPCEPEKYDPKNPDRATDLHLSDDSVAKTALRIARGDEIHPALQSLYRDELRSNTRIGFEHVLRAFPFRDVAFLLREQGHDAAARRVEKYCDRVAAPHAIELLETLIQQGRLVRHRGSVDQIEPEADRGFIIHLRDGSTRSASVVINAAPYVKGAGTPANGHAPLFTQMIAEGVVSIDNGGIVVTGHGGEARPGLAVVGPAAHRGPAWGVESFRGPAHEAGAQLTAKVLSAAQPVLPLSRILSANQRGLSNGYD